MSLRETLAAFAKSGTAIGHFNISDSNQLRAIALAAQETGLPAVVGLSEGERDFFPLEHARALVDRYAAEGAELFLNADHTYDAQKVRGALAAGVDSVVVDGAKLSYDENVRLQKTAVADARASGRDVVMEGELGYIGTSSKVFSELPAGAAITPEMMTSAPEAQRFVEETGVDAFAPAVGNIHGMLGVGRDPSLNIERIREIRAAVSVPLVLHGASGNRDEEIREAIAAGMAMVHINTELRVLYKEALLRALGGEETAPYKFLPPAIDEMKRFVAGKMRLFAQQ